MEIKYIRYHIEHKLCFLSVQFTDYFVIKTFQKSSCKENSLQVLSVAVDPRWNGEGTPNFKADKDGEMDVPRM